MIPRSRLLFATAALLGAALTAACDRQREPHEPGFPAEGLRIAFLPPVTLTPEWDYVIAGARHYVATRGKIEIIEVSRDAYTHDLHAALGIGTDREPHAVVLGVWHGPLVRPVAAELLLTGIPILTYGNRIPIDGIYGHVQVERLDAAEKLARALREIVAPHRSYVLVHAETASEFDQQLFNRFDTVAGKVFSVTQLAAGDAYEADLAPLQVGQNLLADFPNAGLLVSLTSTEWPTIPYERIQSLPCRIALLTAVPPTWRWVRFGEAAAVVGGLDGLGGQKATGLAIAAATRSRPAPLFDILPTELVNTENLDDFIERYAEALGVPPGPLAEHGTLSAP